MSGPLTPRTLMYVGGCNRSLPYCAAANAEGISAFWFDEATGLATPAGVTTGIDNPTFIAIDPSGTTLHATSEVVGWHEGTVSAYAIDPPTGGLTYLNKQPTRGSAAAQLNFDLTGRFLLAVNYGDGPVTQRPNRSFVVYGRRDDGEIGVLTADGIHEGIGTDPDRQERPHAHSITPSPDNRFLVVCDLGLDQLVLYRFNAETGTAIRHGETVLPSGSGPRHFVFHPSKPLAYVVNELTSSVASLAFDAENGRFDVLDVAPTLPGSTTGNFCSEIRISADGRSLFVVNRGHDSISQFSIDEATGIARLVDTVPSGGKVPRHFAFDPSGRFMAVANQNSDVITLFAIDPSDGSLRQLPGIIVAGTPTAVAFVRVPG